MGFVKTKDELDKYFNLSVREFPGAQMLGLMYETRPEIIARLLPPPLEPAAEPWTLCFIANYPVTNLGPGYHESGFFIRCQYKGEAGNFCLSMPISDEARMHNGREIFGFPKKLAKIELKREGNKVEGWVERLGFRFVTVRADLQSKLDQLPLQVGPNFLFKYLPAAGLDRGFDGPIFLVRQRTNIEMKTFEIGSGEILFKDSPHDPWSEVVVENVMTAYYMVSNNRMEPGKVVGEADPKSFLPFSFLKIDFFGGFER